jgi:hypothetical protein
MKCIHEHPFGIHNGKYSSINVNILSVIIFTKVFNKIVWNNGHKEKKTNSPNKYDKSDTFHHL